VVYIFFTSAPVRTPIRTAAHEPQETATESETRSAKPNDRMHNAQRLRRGWNDARWISTLLGDAPARRTGRSGGGHGRG
jgi:hypothetical protein